MNRKIFRITLCVLLTALLLAAFALPALAEQILHNKRFVFADCKFFVLLKIHVSTS